MKPFRRSLALALTLCGSLAWAVPLTAQDAEAAELAAEKERLAREMLEVTGSADLGVQIVTQMIGSFRQANPNVPQELWDQFLAEIEPADLMEITIPIYIEHFTVEEMKAALAFYSTPEGQAIIAKMPVILQESWQAGQAWGAEISQRVVERLQAWKEAHPDS